MSIRVCVLAILLPLAMPVSRASAQILNYLGGFDTDITTLPVNPGTSCYFGNTRTPGALEPYSDEITFFHVEFDSAACDCGGGWSVAEIHLLLANTAESPDTASFIAVYVDGQGQSHPGHPTGCAEPHPGYGGELLEQYYLELTFLLPGYYELVIPASSSCAYFGYEYFLKCYGNGVEEVRFVVDADGARTCEALVAVHIGERWWWQDVHDDDWGYPPWQPSSGAPIWWIEAECCDTPVISEPTSLSHVKTLYR